MDIAVPCLNQLNIDAVFTNISGQRRHVTTIDHNVIARMLSPEEKSVASVIGEQEDESTFLSQLMHALHRINKKVLARLLTEGMAKRINLGVETI